ncbi:hypothetical protein Ddye_009160 [Dipteronia dyeriana]|uniref:Uncharacterized protein n=1 Tax=Dipteronia dyeriana TaxID=168575 RepID=A0AAD9XBU3_9ROSI|nr:hypothetical protein Ddye_009160 [Dipteronia dyeriana]
MSSATKADKKAVVDAAAWMFNVVTSVGIIRVNKALMAMYGFSFGTSLYNINWYAFWHKTILTAFLRKYALGSFNLLGHIAPAQAASLLLLGLFLDYWLTSKRVDAYNYGFASVFFIVLSCSIAVGTNRIQFICIGRFTAVIPSAWPYEDYSGSDIRIHFFRERWSQLACDFGYGHRSCGNDLVW